MSQAFATNTFLCGELQKPRQMLAHQEYGGHVSIHDDAMASKLGFSGAPIEGPTHFSQFDPLLYETFGNAWFERGCISAHYQTWSSRAKPCARSCSAFPTARLEP